MSESSWLPKTWEEALPQVFWGVLILGFGLEFCVSILDANYGRSLLAVVGLVALLAMLIHQEQLRQRLLTVSPNWIAAAFVLFLLSIILSPFVEEKRWPLSAWFPSRPSVGDLSEATAPIIAERDAEKRRADTAERERDAARASVVPLKETVNAERQSTNDTIKKLADELEAARKANGDPVPVDNLPTHIRLQFNSLYTQPVEIDNANVQWTWATLTRRMGKACLNEARVGQVCVRVNGPQNDKNDYEERVAMITLIFDRPISYRDVQLNANGVCVMKDMEARSSRYYSVILYPCEKNDNLNFVAEFTAKP